jgi:flagellar assembly protein FliH
MSLSKVFKHSESFVPKQLLPRQGEPSDPNRQKGAGSPPSHGGHENAFVADQPHGNIKDAGQSPATPEPPPQEEKLSAAGQPAPMEQPPVPAIDLELIREQAFAQGVLEGRRQADEDFGSSALTLRSACNQLTSLHETILRNNLQEMHSLVLLIAEKIIRHSIAEQSQTILATIEDAIRLAVKSEEFQIRVNPEDLEVIKERKKEIIDDISGLDNIVLKTDSTIERGGCILESVNCTVDATIDSQLQVIKQALESSHESGTATASAPE